MKVWDTRQNHCVATSQLPDKIFTMAVTSNRIVVGTSNRHVWIYDVRNLSEPEQQVLPQLWCKEYQQNEKTARTNEGKEAFLTRLLCVVLAA
eukprot:1391607-Rhodomonas_salina.1